MENLADVADVCRRLDGLPLAIELAAARVDRWRAGAAAGALTAHLVEAAGRPRDRPARQQTLRGAIDWSYELLAAADRELFSTLAVFSGGASAEAAVAVFAHGSGPAGAGLEDPVVGRLDLLVGKSLLMVESDTAGIERYRLLETIRAYAMGRLAERVDAAAVHHRHACYSSSSPSAAAPE